MTVQDIILIIYFNEVWEEWMEKNYPLYEIVFDDDALRDPSYINKYQRRFMKEVADKIVENDPSIDRVGHDEILDLVIRRRNEIFRGYYPPPN